MTPQIQQFAHNILTCCTLNDEQAYLTYTIQEEPHSFRVWMQFQETVKARFEISEIDATTLYVILIPLRLFAYRKEFYRRDVNEQSVTASLFFPSAHSAIRLIARSPFLFSAWYNDMQRNYPGVAFTPDTIYLTAAPFFRMFYSTIIPLITQAATNLPLTFPIINRQEFEDNIQQYEDLRV